jgi:hypothetical protein
MIKNGLMAVAAAAALAVAGCGGGGGDSNKKLSYSDFSNKANDICKTANAKSAGAKLTNDLKADAAVLDQQIPNVESALADFKKLNPPDELKSDFDQFLSISDQQLANAKKARDAAKAGDKAGFIAALKATAPLQAQSHATGSKLGAAECAK